MELGAVYQLAIVITLICMVVGVGILVIDKFQTAAVASMTTKNASEINLAAAALGNGSAALAELPKTWIGLIITITVLAVIVGLVVMSFSGGMARK